MIKKEFIDLFFEKLHLEKYSRDVQLKFLSTMVRYLNHGNKGKSNDRTLGYVSRKLDTLIKFLKALDFTDEEMLKVLMDFPAILGISDELYTKYLLLGITENEDNTIRREKLLNSPKDFMIGLSTMYARFCLIRESGYNKFNWNCLAHISSKEFSNIFVKRAYYKPYKIFDTEEEVLSWMEKVDISSLDIVEFKNLKVNEELVKCYESKESSRKY